MESGILNMSPPAPPQPPPLPPPIYVTKPIGSREMDSTQLVRPTTAGLMQYPSISSQSVHLSNGDSILFSDPSTIANSKQFKDELLNKQLRLSESNGLLSIEDKIRENKEKAARLTLSPSPHNNESQYQNGMPEKLLTTCQGDKRPFAYSPDVNDPNHRGKLDLNQIKSPMMRRRLLANLQSSEEETIDDSNECSPVNTMNDQPPNNDLNQQSMAQQQYQDLIASPSGSIRRDQVNCFPKELKQKTVPYPQIQKYHEPPIFYNTNHGPPMRQQIDTNPYRNSTIDELELELAKSLDSITLLASNLGSQRSNTGNGPVFNHRIQRSYEQRDSYQPQQRMSTFVSNDHMNCLNDGQGQYQNRNHNRSSLDRSIGDIMLSPDSNYFSTAASANPYSISPYYGSPFDVDYHESTLNQHTKPVSARTFSPNPATSRLREPMGQQVEW